MRIHGPSRFEAIGKGRPRCSISLLLLVLVKRDGKSGGVVLSIRLGRDRYE
jgi:hypothetical protein